MHFPLQLLVKNTNEIDLLRVLKMEESYGTGIPVTFLYNKTLLILIKFVVELDHSKSDRPIINSTTGLGLV